MGPVRGRLSGIAAGALALIALAATPARAADGACAELRPGWDGVRVGALEEALALALSPAALVLLAATLIALRFRSQWGALAVVLLWTAFLSLVTMLDPTGLRAAGQAEGCLGSPVLFIALVMAICAGLIVYTLPRLGKPQ